ncbi:MAG: hypothetical protein GXP45_07455 [bacterium]|nr:hypothetical protein [bacterium]
MEKIIHYCKKFPNQKKIFIPCDLKDDAQLYPKLQQEIDNIQYYDWTQHSLMETLQLFYHAESAI